MFAEKHDEQLDHLISEIRAQDIAPAALEDSARRVWHRIEAASATIPASEAPRGCATIRTYVSLERRRELSPARRLLVEDHLRECPSCRAYALGAPDPVAAAENWRLPRPAGNASARILAGHVWAVAAVVLLLVASWIGVHYLAVPAGSRAQIESIAGRVYLVSPVNESPLRTGEQIGQGEVVRTASDAHAILRLLDGSRVEMSQRTELSVATGWLRNTTIHLDQGDIIVQARHRSTGRLYVRTPDCTVSDTGTIFSIESGTKGSRVGVVEGAVSVAHDGKESVLNAGQSLSTTESMNTVPVRGQIAWSEDRQQYLALLDEFSRLGHRFEQIPSPQPRYQSQILPLVPEGTVLYLSVPNLGNMFAQGDRIFRDELQRSPALRDWWTRVATPQQDASLEQAISKIETASQYFGDEMVLVSGLDDKDGPVLLAPIKNPGLADFLRQRVSSLGGDSWPPVRIADERSLASVSSAGKELVALVRPDVLVVGTLEAVVHMNTALADGPSGFVNTAFGQQVQGIYNEGAQVLLAADLRRIMAHSRPTEQAKSSSGTEAARDSVLDKLGFGDMKYLIATHGGVSGQTENRALLGFEHERGGLASLLGAPAPMGSLDFVSANATEAVAVVTKEPAKMFDDVVRMIQQHDRTNVVSAEAEQEEDQIGIDFRNNLAGALGGEMAFALDGPMLPKPAWKLMAEVNEPSVLQQSISTLVQLAGQHVMKSGRPAVAIEQQQSGDRTFYRITFAQAPDLAEIDYTFADGYLVAGSSRAIVLNALATRASGDSLASSGSFRSLLPRDSYANFSALMYWNLGPVARSLVALDPADQSILQHFAADSRPAAICAYGGPNSIELASTTNLLDLQPDTLSLLALLKQGVPGTSRGSNP